MPDLHQILMSSTPASQSWCDYVLMHGEEDDNHKQYRDGTSGYQLNASAIAKWMDGKANQSILKIQRKLVPFMRENMEWQIKAFGTVVGFSGTFLIAPTGMEFSGYTTGVLWDKLLPKLENLEKMADPHTFLKVAGMNHYAAWCAGCGYKYIFNALTPYIASGIPRFFFFQTEEMDDMVSWIHQHFKLSPIFAKTIAYCEKCRQKCKSCGHSVVNRIFNGDLLLLITSEGVCLKCGSTLLASHPAPKLSREDLVKVSRKFIIG